MILLKHPRIVDVYQAYFSAREGTFVMLNEFCEYGSLQDFINYEKSKDRSTFPEDYIRLILADLTEAIDHMHSKNWIHGDIKPANVFVTRDGHVKLGDFGDARKLHRGGDTELKLEHKVGTLRQMSPEMADEMIACKANDIWGIGTILLEACMQKPLTTDVRSFNEEGEDIANALPRIYKDELVDLIRKLLHPECTKRPTIDELRGILPPSESFDPIATVEAHFQKIELTSKRFDLVTSEVGGKQE